MEYGAQPPCALLLPRAQPGWAPAVCSDLAAGPMVIDWLGFGCSQIMITLRLGPRRREYCRTKMIRKLTIQ